MNEELSRLVRFVLITALIALFSSIGLYAAWQSDTVLAVSGPDAPRLGLPAGPAADVEGRPGLARLAADSATFDTLTHRFALEPNRPNPFAGSTVISYSLDAATHVELTIYDFFYRKIQTVVSMDQPAGRYSVEWPNAETTENPPSGIYFCTLATDRGVEQLRMILMK